MTGELWTVIGLLLTNAGILFGMFKYLVARIEKVDEEHDKKIARVYERLDEHKDLITNKFVQKDMCKVLHDQGALNVTGLELRLTSRMDKLENKFDQIIALLTNK